MITLIRLVLAIAAILLLSSCAYESGEVQSLPDSISYERVEEPKIRQRPDPRANLTIDQIDQRLREQGINIRIDDSFKRPQQEPMTQYEQEKIKLMNKQIQLYEEEISRQRERDFWERIDNE